MRLVVQRVKSASVKVGSKVYNKIKEGLLLYVGIEKSDTIVDVKFVANKVLKLRVFPDSNEKMNYSVKEVEGEILSISQFTLASYLKKGRRPDFSNAKKPEDAELLYKTFNSILRKEISVKEGIFGAMMEVKSVNNGPVTFIIEKKEK
jgi:D-tyrosyl-tRNA(Tyr) deacylase